MTAQFREGIYIDDKIYGMASEPLENYLIENFNGKDDGTYPYLVEISTACWRGYIGTWKIENDQLFLQDISNQKEEELNIDQDGTILLMVKVNENEYKFIKDWRKVFFNNQQGDIKASWFTGRLIVEMGKMIEYVHMYYGSQYEKYMIIDIKNGDVVKKEILTNEEYNQARKKFKDF